MTNNSSTARLLFCSPLGLGMLPPTEIGFTPCTCNIADLALPIFFAFTCLLYTFHISRKKYVHIFPIFGCLFRTKLILSYVTLLTQIVLVVMSSINGSLRTEFLSILSIAASTGSILTWMINISLMYVSILFYNTYVLMDI